MTVGYGYVPPEPPPPYGHLPPPPRAPRNGLLATSITSGVVGAVFLLVWIFSGTGAANCNSGLGQIAQGFSQRAANDCGLINVVHDGAIFLTIVSAVAFVVSTVAYLRR